MAKTSRLINLDERGTWFSNLSKHCVSIIIVSYDILYFIDTIFGVMKKICIL